MPTAKPRNLFSKSITRALATFVCLATWVSSIAQTPGVDTSYPQGFVHASLHSCKLHPSGTPNAHPIVPLNNGKLTLSFDDFSASLRTLEIRWKHCTFDWYDSPDLSSNDYVAGFSSLSFEQVEASFNTKTPYTHYATSFPNDLMSFTKSGNYIVEVYDSAEPQKPLAQLRFVLYESLIGIEMDVHESSIIRDQRTHQEVDLALMHSSERYAIQDAYDALQVVLLQNGRWETAIMGLEPQFVRGEEVTFNPTGDQSFAGGNSWRFTDLKSLRFASLGIQRIMDEGDRWHAYLEPDESRSYEFLKARPDIDGHYVISNELQDDATGGDYVWAHFSLKAFEERLHEDIYIYGELSQWTYLETHRMRWNEQTRRYEAKLFLKQGYYNYEYRIRPSLDRGKNDFASLQSQPSNVAAIEGSHARSDTPYMCIVYYWDFQGFDRVIGFAQAKPGDIP